MCNFINVMKDINLLEQDDRLLGIDPKVLNMVNVINRTLFMAISLYIINFICGILLDYNDNVDYVLISIIFLFIISCMQKSNKLKLDSYMLLFLKNNNNSFAHRLAFMLYIANMIIFCIVIVYNIVK
jgi:hypothetical protein